MSGNKDGYMVILSSPSGAGKTTLVKLINQKKNNFKISISHTTRKPRNNEVNGQDYHFVDISEFKRLINENELLEYAKVFKHFYGTTKTPVIKNLNEGYNVIFDIDWQGTSQIVKKKLNYRLLTFFILPPSKDTLLKRLSNRDMKDKLIVEERMKDFSQDVLHWEDYDYVVINDDLERCYEEIVKLINLGIDKNKFNYDKDFIKNHIKKLIN